MNLRIKKLRKHYDMTQQDFAERIGLKQNSIALIESGKRNISNQAILSICREFDVNETWLRTGEGEMFLPKDTDSEIAEFIGTMLSDANPSFKKRLIKALSELPEEAWQGIEAFAKRLVSDEPEHTLPPNEKED